MIDEKFAMLYSYAQKWQSMSNDDSLIFMRRWLELDEKIVQLRSKYLLLVKDALPGKKAATFFQLDERITMMINLEFAGATSDGAARAESLASRSGQSLSKRRSTAFSAIPVSRSSSK